MDFQEWLINEMNEEEGFVNTLKAHPEDMTTWLVYADWLEERDDPRSSLIRALTGRKTTSNMKRVDEVWTWCYNNKPDFLWLLTRAFTLARYAYGFSTRRRTVTLSQTAEIMKLIKNSGRSGKQVNETLEKISKILDSFGVESIRQEHMGNGYWADTAAAYVNVGDSYEQTVLYDVRANRFLITTVGDFVEGRPDLI
jgi:uncharacterized protein (TIGR02996 family)